ncbi:DNA cytosine methyltransferase [Domibacillus sp. 8LH]|uniref:DNA cytosine methyltransferase n=1 Tax=Domibacillus sp. 8LH TaxID=3073900 RepID=UPI0031773EE2
MRQLNLFNEKTDPSTRDFYSILKESLGLTFEGNWIEEFSVKLREKQKTKTQTIKVLSLFSGGGGLDIGVEDAGFEIVESVEIDKHCAATLSENIKAGILNKNCIVKSLDIRDYDPSHLIGEVDFIIGGPPCQTFSAAGRRASGVLGTTDDRGTLFEEYVRILEVLQPKAFLFENVSGILGAEKGESWRMIQEAFAEVGYKLHFRVLDTADYGVPQFRERLIIIGTKDGIDYRFPRPTHGPDSIAELPFYSAQDAIEGAYSSKDEIDRKINGKYGHLLEEVPPGLNYSFFTEKMGHPNPIFAWRSKFSDFLYKADPLLPVRTLKAQGGQYTGPFHWENRAFSIGELKRLQTFPDNYVFSGGRMAAIKQIGNSVPPQIARILSLSVLKQIFNVDIPFEIETLSQDEPLGFKSRKKLRTKMYEKIATEYLASRKVESKDLSKKNIIDDRSYSAIIDLNNFKWQEVSDATDVVNIEVKNENDSLMITAFEKKQKNDFTIELKPTLKGWDIGYKSIFLKGGELNEKIFLAVWKALDHELALNKVKADLVQLCGYYQYKPKFACEISYPNDKIQKKWEIVSKVVTGEGIPKLKSVKDLAEEWDVQEELVLSYAQFLKSIGFEIRNKNTNPQILADHYLIPYKFPTLTPVSVQLQKSLGVEEVMESKLSQDKPEGTSQQIEPHLIVYPDRSIYNSGQSQVEFKEGAQNAETKERYNLIQANLKSGYLEKLIEEVKTNPDVINNLTLSDEAKEQIEKISSYTSEQGRGLIGVLVGQLAIKAIAPVQDIRLHKGNNASVNFSWVEGVSMRTINTGHVISVLRSHDLLKVNNFGSMMTRTFAENYPYSPLYKATIKGPKKEWLILVDMIQEGKVDALAALKYLLSHLANKSDEFNSNSEQAIKLTKELLKKQFELEDAADLVIEYMNSTKYAPRVFEVALHSLLQILDEQEKLPGVLNPLSQMRSANKKHGNIGDVEISPQRDSNLIIEAWDAKYKKPYLLDELEELSDKLEVHAETALAGFVVDSPPIIDEDVNSRKTELEELYNTHIKILSFKEWVNFKAEDTSIPDLAGKWLLAFVESLCQKRREYAPIDEPCNDWVKDLIALLEKK